MRLGRNRHLLPEGGMVELVMNTLDQSVTGQLPDRRIGSLEGSPGVAYWTRGKVYVSRGEDAYRAGAADLAGIEDRGWLTPDNWPKAFSSKQAGYRGRIVQLLEAAWKYDSYTAKLVSAADVDRVALEVNADLNRRAFIHAARALNNIARLQPHHNTPEAAPIVVEELKEELVTNYSVLRTAMEACADLANMREALSRGRDRAAAIASSDTDLLALETQELAEQIAEQKAWAEAAGYAEAGQAKTIEVEVDIAAERNRVFTRTRGTGGGGHVLG